MFDEKLIMISIVLALFMWLTFDLMVKNYNQYQIGTRIQIWLMLLWLNFLIFFLG